MWRTFKVFFDLMWLILVINKRRTKRLFTKLEIELAKQNLVLGVDHKKRIASYTNQIAITNHWFSLLRNKKPDKSEIENALYLGALTPIVDDLMDGGNITYEELKSSVLHTPEQVMFAFLFGKTQHFLNGNYYWERSIVAQNESLKQLRNAPLPLEELKQISFDKGGFFTLLYRVVLHHRLIDREEEALFTLGSMLQLLNDLFDIYKDNKNSAQTIATSTRDINLVKRELTLLEDKFCKQYLALAYPPEAKRKSLSSILSIVARGHVALEYYKSLQGNKPQLDIERYSRKELVVDMEKPINILKLFIATKRAIRARVSD